MEDLTRLINLHGAYNTRQASPFRLIETWLRFIFRVLSRSTIGYFLFHLFPPGVLGIYFTMLIVNILNWFYENLLIIFGEFAYHENPRSSSSRNILRYLRYVEGVEPESADYPVVRRSGRRTSSSAGHTMGTSEGLPGGQLSAQQASGGLWRWVSRSFGYEWGHRQADSHRGPNVASNFGSESLGANSQEMVDEKFALDLNRTNPGQVRRRNFALRHVGTLADRVRRTTIFLLGNALISAVIRSDRSPMTTVERTNLEGDYEQQRDIIVGFNLRNALIIPLFTLIIAYIIRFLTG